MHLNNDVPGFRSVKPLGAAGSYAESATNRIEDMDGTPMNHQRRGSTPTHHSVLPDCVRPSTTITLTRLIAGLAAAVLTIPLVHSIAQAAPPPPSVHYQLSQTPTGVNLSVSDGSISREGNDVVVKNSAGQALFRMGLRYRSEYLEYPIDAAVSGKSVSLTPSRDVSRAHPLDPRQVNAVRQVAAKQAPPKQTRQQRDNEALDRFNGVLNAGMTISSLVGLAIGAVVGGIAGCAIAGVTLTPLGCVFAGIPIGAGVGSIVGVILGGGGTLIVAAIQYFQTITSPV